MECDGGAASGSRIPVFGCTGRSGDRRLLEHLTDEMNGLAAKAMLGWEPILAELIETKGEREREDERRDWALIRQEKVA